MANVNETLMDLGDEVVVVTWIEDEAESASDARDGVADDELERSLTAGAAVLTQIAALIAVAVYNL